MPLYTVTETGAADRLVEATTPAQAVRFAMGDRIKAKVVSDPVEAVALIGKGMTVEKAGKEPEAKADPAGAQTAA